MTEQLDALMVLARNRAEDSRRLLFQNMTDLFMSAEGRLSERERALMHDILGKLLHEMEMDVRRELVDRLAQSESTPHELIVALANEEIEIARPVLLSSTLLHDLDLVEIIKQRGQEHRLVIAMRQGLSSLVSQYLIDTGDELVVEKLLTNHEASVSRQAIDYLVEQSKRTDRFQEPLLRRPDLPSELAHRMFWWVSASLRQVIVAQYQVDETLLDDALTTAAAAAACTAGQTGGEAERLVRRLTERGELSERFVLQNLRTGHVSAAIAGLAGLSGLDVLTTRRVMLDRGGEALAVCCKVAGFSRGGFASTFLLTREAHERGTVTDPAVVELAVGFFDRVQPGQARAILRLWMRDNGYFAAVAKLAGDRVSQA